MDLSVLCMACAAGSIQQEPVINATFASCGGIGQDFLQSAINSLQPCLRPPWISPFCLPALPPPPNSSQSAKGGVDGLLPINMSNRCSNATVAEQRMELELLFCPAPPQQQHIQMYIIISWGVLPGGVLPNTNTGKKAHNVQKT